jgi:hypothetical protein
MVRSTTFACFAAAMLLGALPTASAATVTGIVTDASGKPVENARIDHTGKIVVVAATHLAIKPSPNQIRTDSEGHFRVVTDAPAVVVRKPGYESQRVRIAGDARVQVTLRRVESTSRCKLSAPPVFRTKQANDVDYTATWFYIKTKDGPKGIISGSGPTYSFGAPSDSDVWTSVEYAEFMYESGVIDAAGRSADGTYWRSRSIFGAVAQYYRQNRETAEQLDCVMDRIPVELP